MPHRSTDSPNTTSPKIVTVAIIGSGLAGLTACYELLQLNQQQFGIRYQVHLFEKGPKSGFEGSSTRVSCGERVIQVDSPMRSVNKGSHPAVLNLYKSLGIPVCESNFRFSFSRMEKFKMFGKKWTTRQETEYIYQGSNGLRWPPLAFPEHFVYPTEYIAHVYSWLILGLSYVYLLLLVFFYYFIGFITRVAETGKPNPRRSLFSRIIRTIDGETWHQWRTRHRIGALVDRFTVDLMCGVTSGEETDVQNMPAIEVLAYIITTFLASHYVVDGGVGLAVPKLLEGLPSKRFYTNTAVEKITLSHSETTPQITLHCVTTSSNDKSERSFMFDHVILATQANQAAYFLQNGFRKSSLHPNTDLEDERIAALQLFKYSKVAVTTHTDASVLPDSESDWRELNILSVPNSTSFTTTKTIRSIQITHLILKSEDSYNSMGYKHIPKVVLQTTNPLAECSISPESILTHTNYERAIVTVNTRRVLGGFILPDEHDHKEEPEYLALQLFDRLCSIIPEKQVPRSVLGKYQGLGSIWFVGSWCDDGIPLLEGCVRSSQRVVQGLHKHENASLESVDNVGCA